MGMGSKKTVVGYKYGATMHMGLGMATDEIYRIDIGGKVAWTGAVKQNSTIAINQANLFGGIKGEGGVEGSVDFMFGSESQNQNGRLLNYLGNTIPAFRNTVTAVFSGFLCAMNWYPKTWEFYYRRIKTGWNNNAPWYPEKILITLADGKIQAMNPAHIIYESYVSNTWGAGVPDAQMDSDAYKKAADTLYAEGFGLCFEWKATDELKSLRSFVCDHIGAVLGTDPTTGKNTIRLIRDDYKLDDLPVFDEDTGLLDIKLEATNNTEVPSQVIVKYNDAITFEERPVYANNPAIGQGQRGKTTETTEYLAIPTGELATRVAYRDLKSKTSGIKRCTLTMDRRAFDIVNGQPFRVKTKYRINNIDMVVRATRREEKFLTNGEILLSVTQDAFSLPKLSYNIVPPTPTPELPKPPVAITNSLLIEAPYRELAGFIDPANLQLLDSTSSYIFSLAESPNSSCYSYDLITRVQGAANFAETEDTGIWCPTSITSSDISYSDKVFHIKDTSLLTDVEVGSAALINDEIVRVDKIDFINNQLTVGRGCIDTVPAKHAEGSVIWFYDSHETTDGIEYSVGNTVETKLLSNTFRERLEPNKATTQSINVKGRQGRPYPPGNLKINGMAYPEEIKGTTINITWSSRNRLLQGDKLIDTTASNTDAEDKTSYNLLVKFKNVEVAKINKLTANNYLIKIDNSYSDSALLILNDLTDLSSKLWISKGDTLFDTVDPKVGNTSLKLNGGWLQTTEKLDDFSFVGDFTVEAWIKVTKLNYGVIIDNYKPNTNSWQFASDNNRLCFWSTNLGYLYAGTIPLNTWVHVAASRENGQLKLFINGSLAAKYTDITQYIASSVVAIGAQRGNPTTSYNFYGNINQVRLTKGLARYIDNFNPTDIPYDYQKAKGSRGDVSITLEAEREDLTSYQKHSFTFSCNPE